MIPYDEDPGTIETWSDNPENWGKSMEVYIMTRQRQDNLVRVVPRWIDQDFHVTLVVDKTELRAHQELMYAQHWIGKVIITSPKESDRGFGYIQKYIVEHAASRSFKSIIMSDDDIRPATNSNMSILLKEASKPEAVGVAAARSIHDRFTNGAITRLRNEGHGLIMCPGGWGMQFYGLNIQNAIDIGNFDPELDMPGDDHEFLRNCITFGIPWLVHCDVWAESIGARHAKGGYTSLVSGEEERERRQQRVNKIIHDRWPEYTTAPPARMRTQWKKLLDDYIPGWHLLSALHGGDLKNRMHNNNTVE